MTLYHISYCVLDSLCRYFFIVEHLDVPASTTGWHAKTDAFVWSWAHWWDWRKDKGRLIITVVGHPLPLTRSGGIYLIRLVCSVSTLCERHFNSVTHEEKLRGLCVDYWHEYMLNGFSHWSNCCCCAGPLWWSSVYVLLIRYMIDGACQDSITTASLFWHCLGVMLWF